MKADFIWVCSCGEVRASGAGDDFRFKDSPDYRGKYRCPKCSGVMEKQTGPSTTRVARSVQTLMNTHFPKFHGKFSLRFDSSFVLLDIELFEDLSFDQKKFSTLLLTRGLYYRGPWEERGHLIFRIT